MKVIVCGAGQVGFNIAKHLAAQNNDVTVIDRSAKLIRKISESLDVSAMEGYASDPDTLDRAGAASADMIIGVTMSDEVNMMACQVAHSLFDVPTKIARVRNQSYLKPEWQDLFSRDNMPIDVVISPEVEVANALKRRMTVPGAFEVIPFADEQISVAGVRLPDNCPVLETPLRQLTELFPGLEITVLGIIRDRKMFMPTPDDFMQAGDSIYFSVDSERIARSMEVFGFEPKAARHVVILGGGNVGRFLAKNLEEDGESHRVSIVEYSQERAEVLAEELPNTLVLNGDGLDPEILREAGADRAELFFAVTNDDQVNILASMLAKDAGTERTITLVSNPTYSTLMRTLGIDVYVDPRETTVSTIIQHIRRGKIRGLHSIRGGEAEIIEAEAMETSSVVGKTLAELNFGKDIMLGGILRDGEVMMARGSTVFKAGDRIVILARQDAVKQVEQLFSVRLEFF